MNAPRAARLIAAAALAFAASAAMAADKDVEALLSHMRDAYKAVKTAKYTTMIKVVLPAGGDTTDTQPIDLTTDFTYEAPNKLRATVHGIPGSDGKDGVLVSDGKKVSMEGAIENSEKADFTNQALTEATGFIGNLESICFWDWDTQLSTGTGKNMAKSTFNIIKSKKWDDKDWEVLEETAKEQNVLVEYYIDPKTFFIWRTVVHDLKDPSKVSQDAKITKLKIGVDVDESDFVVH